MTVAYFRNSLGSRVKNHKEPQKGRSNPCHICREQSGTDAGLP
jgi:hypothetical protein